MEGLIGAVSVGTAEPARPVLPWLVALSFGLLMRSAPAAITDYLAAVLRERVDGAMYRDVFEKAVRLQLAAFESPEYYNKLENGLQAVAGRLVYVLQELSHLISAGIGVAGLLFLFVRAHWALAAVLLGSVLLSGTVGVKLTAYFERVNYASSPSRREINYWSGVLTNRGAAAEIRVYQLGETILRKWLSAFDRYYADISQARLRVARSFFIVGVVRESILWATTAAILVLTWVGTVPFGTMVALLYGVGRFREAVNDVSWTAAGVVEHGSKLRYLRAFLALPETASAAGRLPPPQPMREGVTFHNVSFTYPGAKRAAIQNVSVTFRPGERVALVGENGAGKSTLVRLLLGLYQPTEGRITVDGIDLADIDAEAWRRELSVVFQDFVRYPATVRENIGLGDVDVLQASSLAGEHPRILDAARTSGADEFVPHLPAGYRTLLGKQFEGGVELSTGQWQRIALARAYVRDAQIIVLDEPTAALDPQAEVQVYEAFREAAAGKCAVFISHRLGSARLADRILVMKEGRVVESGTHESLLAEDGEYARMYRLQAAWYGDESEAVTG